jgi:NitT/TauT family transport system ATP-binding protein
MTMLSRQEWKSTGEASVHLPNQQSQATRTAIRIKNVTKEYGEGSTSHVEALKGVDLTIGQGELVTLVGPSGCGKSTLLNLIAGLDTFSSGEIEVEGKRVSEPLKIGYVLQQDTSLPWRNVQANAEFALEIAGVGRKERRDIASTWLNKLGLGRFASHYPYQLSGGMRKRLQLAAVLATEPRILLMDEPFGPLDAQTRTLIEDDFLRLWRDVGMTVVFVTHDLAEAIAMSTRVVIVTARPGRVKSQYEIDLPGGLSTTDRKLDAKYQDLYSHIWNDLRDEVGSRLD